jgi:hypothetical protein
LEIKIMTNLNPTVMQSDESYLPDHEITNTPMPSGVIQQTNAEHPETTAEPAQPLVYGSSIYGYARREGSSNLFPTESYIAQIASHTAPSLFAAIEKEREKKTVAADIERISKSMAEFLGDVKIYDEFLASNLGWRLARWIENEVSYNMANAVKCGIDGKERVAYLKSRKLDAEKDKSVNFCINSGARSRNTSVLLTKLAPLTGQNVSYDFATQSRKVAENGATRLNRNPPLVKTAEQLAEVSTDATSMLFDDMLGSTPKVAAAA